jgi:hypothetical protein
VDYIVTKQPNHLFQQAEDPVIEMHGSWILKGNKYQMGPITDVPSPILELNDLATLEKKGDRTAFNQRVRGSFASKFWNILRTSPRAQSAERKGAALPCKFFKFGAHGPAIKFAKVKGLWRASQWYDRV